jgi:hypothetical protein
MNCLDLKHKILNGLIFSYIRTLFQDVGLDHFIEGNFKINTFNRFFGMNNTIKERSIIETKTTLETYKTFFVSRGHKNI